MTLIPTPHLSVRQHPDHAAMLAQLLQLGLDGLLSICVLLGVVGERLLL